MKEEPRRTAKGNMANREASGNSRASGVKESFAVGDRKLA